MLMYLKIDEIKGEVTNNAYKEWIQVHSFSWSETAQIDPASGQAAGRAQISAFKFFLKSGIATPLLALGLLQNKVYKKASLVIKETKLAGGRGSVQNKKIITADMYNVIIESLTFGGSEADQAPGDQLSLVFQKMELGDGSVRTIIAVDKPQLG
jgi:type VI protein secretion system component Hcp